MILNKLFNKQRKLDDLIVITNLSKRVGKTVTHKQLINQRMLSVYVELGEFIKETDHNLKKGEYIDILHFLLSCGLALEIDKEISKFDINILYAQAVERNYNDAIINFDIKLSDFANCVRSFKYWSVNRTPKPNVGKKYYKCFLALFDIAKNMGYTVEDIEAAYEEKNRENYYRQESNY